MRGAGWCVRPLQEDIRSIGLWGLNFRPARCVLEDPGAARASQDARVGEDGEDATAKISVAFDLNGEERSGVAARQGGDGDVGAARERGGGGEVWRHFYRKVPKFLGNCK